jgi:beta-1,4-mannosyltransferase
MGVLPIIPLNEKKYDFLIWGQIQPYKGIIDFLTFVRSSEYMKSIKILIIGKCFDEEYKTELNKYLSDNITHQDKFYELEQISKFANQTKFILFTYKSNSLLSSGSLMDSIRMRSLVIGPNDGAFKDLSTFQFVKVYNNFEDIIGIHKNYLNVQDSINLEIEEFCVNNNWDIFGDKLNAELIKILT